MILWGAILFWLAAWAVNAALARSRYRDTRAVRLLAPVLFGLTILVLWQGLVRGLNVSPVILPAPTDVAHRIASDTGVLWEDFSQTVLKGALSGYLIGASAAVLTAIAIDRSTFLTPGTSACRQLRRGAADRWHRADPCELVRLRLAL